VGEGHHLDARVFVQNHLPGPQFVSRVDVGMEEADGDGRHTEGPQSSRGLAHSLFVQRRLDLSLRGHALGDLEPDATAGDGGGGCRGRVPDVLLEAAAELYFVPETFGDDEPGGGSLHLYQGIVAGRRPVHDGAGLRQEVGQLQALDFSQLGQAGQHAVALILRRGRSLLQGQAAIGPPQHAVREGPSHVHADPVTHLLDSLSSFVASKSTASVISSDEPVITTP
jgi:hypothetical protein